MRTIPDVEFEWPPPGGEPVEGPPPGGEPVEEPPPGGEPVEEPHPGGEPVEEPPPGGEPVEEPPTGGEPVEEPPSHGAAPDGSFPDVTKQSRQNIFTRMLNQYVLPSTSSATTISTQSQFLTVPRQLPTKRKLPRLAVDGGKRKRGSTKRKLDSSVKSKIRSLKDNLMLNKKAKPPTHYLCDVCGNKHYVKYDRIGSKRGRCISCTICNVWVHGSCVGWTDNDIDTDKTFICSVCSVAEIVSEIV